MTVASGSLKVELLRDSARETGWWLMVGGSEQSFVDIADPTHLEFEYVQIVADVIESTFEPGTRLDVLHLGGGLCTMPRWIAATRAGSKQRIVEASEEIARLSASLGRTKGARVVIRDAAKVIKRARPDSVDLLICDVYDGPETVTTLFTRSAVRRAHDLLCDGGLYVCNISDAAPFALSRVVAATLREVFAETILLAEPPVLRGRRSGNIVFAASDTALPLAAITRRASGGTVRARVMDDDELEVFAAEAHPADEVTQLPPSGESRDLHLAKF